jgi:hypothetical protein
VLQEFKEFALRGNVVDMRWASSSAPPSRAVRSLVDDIIMPPLGVVTGGVDFSNMFVSLDGKSYTSLALAKEAGAPTINFSGCSSTQLRHRRLRAVHGDQSDEPATPHAGGGVGQGAAALARGAAAPGHQGRPGKARLERRSDGGGRRLPGDAHAALAGEAFEDVAEAGTTILLQTASRRWLRCA